MSSLYCICSICANHATAAFFARSSALFLPGIALITTYGKSVSHSREVLVVIIHIRPRNDAVRMCFQLRREVLVMLRGEDLHSDSNCVDLLFRKKTRMRSGDTINEVDFLPNISSSDIESADTLRSELEHSPSTIAEAHGPQLLELTVLLQCFGTA